MLNFILQHGYIVVFGAVLAEQIGLPIPAVPALLAVGVLAASGKMSYAAGIFICVLACAVADTTWYFLGRNRGGSILNLLCRISLEPDSCVRRTENVFLRYGARSLLFSKFVPGMGTAATPMAGLFRMQFGRFLAFDAAGSLAWAMSYSLLGMLFRNQMTMVLDALRRAGFGIAAVVVTVAAGYAGYKYIQRRRFIRKLRVARISPEDLLRLMEAGEPHSVVDLRSAVERETEPERIPGALAITFEDLDSDAVQIPLDRDVVLYCT